VHVLLAIVTQAQRVLNVVKKEVDRWTRSGMESEIKHKQVSMLEQLDQTAARTKQRLDQTQAGQYA
jgi:flagellar biosynthesis chaperone FliJ